MADEPGEERVMMREEEKTAVRQAAQNTARTSNSPSENRNQTGDRNRKFGREKQQDNIQGGGGGRRSGGGGKKGSSD
jgi:hypothetical protein